LRRHGLVVKKRAEGGRYAPEGGRYAPEGYAVTLVIPGVLQLAARAWLVPMRESRPTS
jgi:hypothetical protein